VGVLFSDRSLLRYLDTNELVTFCVFAFASFEPSDISGTVSLCGLCEFTLQCGQTWTGFHGAFLWIRKLR
jgi:hypothetical protein